MKGIEIRGNMIGLVTALVMLVAVLWQSYEDYCAAHPAPTTLQPPSAATTPIYWHDGQRWWCQIGDKRYVWNQNPNPNSERIAHVEQQYR
jgi:hypothetical protein